MSRPLTVISLYTGIGGLDFGFASAGYQTLAAADIDPAISRIFVKSGRRISSLPWRYIDNGDLLRPQAGDELLEAAGRHAGEVDVIIGGPPCQPFSKSGRWRTGRTQRMNDPRATTISAYLDIVEKVRPAVFLFENVPAFDQGSDRDGPAYVKYRLGQIDLNQGTKYLDSYSSNCLNALDYGVPQRRQRFFLVCSANGSRFAPPAATHGEGLLPLRTCWDALAGCKVDHPEQYALTGRWADLLPTIPEGQNYLWHTSRYQPDSRALFGWRRRYWSFLLKLAKNQPSWTIQAQPGSSTGPFHWENRRLSPHEIARLQTFPNPDDLEFDCSYRDSHRLLGNAVPSLLAEVLAREIALQFLSKRFYRGGPKLQIDHVKAPRASRTSRIVPEKYLREKLDIMEHPGAGLGPIYQ